jgi:hypothetical protein
VTNPIEPILPEEAAAIIESKLAELEREGWKVVVQHDYMARLNRQHENLEVHIDLLGNIRIDEKPLTILQESGRIIAILLFLIMILFILAILSILGL